MPQRWFVSVDILELLGGILISKIRGGCFSRFLENKMFRACEGFTGKWPCMAWQTGRQCRMGNMQNTSFLHCHACAYADGRCTVTVIASNNCMPKRRILLLATLASANSAKNTEHEDCTSHFGILKRSCRKKLLEEFYSRGVVDKHQEQYVQ